MTKKILLVDDEPNVLDAFHLVLRKRFTIETALSGEEGLKLLGNGDGFGVVVADMQMPNMNGVEFLARVKEIAPDIVRIMLTGNGDQNTAIEAINEGSIFRFLNKPSPHLSEALNDALRQHQLLTTERELLENTLHGSVKMLTEILALAEPKAFGQAQLLRDNIRVLAQAMNVQETWELEVAAMLSRIGSITIPPEILLKEREGQPLSEREQKMFSNIPEIGGNLLARIPRLEGVSKIILYQEKNFDGSGFPEDEVAGEQIPLGARMLKILSALAEHESAGASRDAAIKNLREEKDAFDPEILARIDTLPLASPNSTSPAKPKIPITFADLRVGHLLCSDVETCDGILIVSGGNRVTPTLMQRLRNFSMLSGIKEPIYVEG